MAFATCCFCAALASRDLIDARAGKNLLHPSPSERNGAQQPRSGFCLDAAMVTVQRFRSPGPGISRRPRCARGNQAISIGSDA